MAVGEQRGSVLHIGPHEGFDRRSGIVRDHGEADAARARIEVFRSHSSGLRLVDVAINHLDGTGNQYFPRLPGIEERVAGSEGDLRLIDLNHPFKRLAVRIDHRSPQLLCQQPGGLVGEVELLFELPRRHPIGMRRHQMRRPEPRRQWQLGAMHHRARRDRGLSAAVEAFVGMRTAFQHRRTAVATGRADEAVGPALLKQERRAACLVGKCLLELRKRPRSGHCLSC